jgi:hypothetical protein
MRIDMIDLAGTAATIIALGCASHMTTPITDITGTWGGNDAGLIATDTSAHVHIGCTLGDVKGRIVPDAQGHFVVSGTYNVDAYPIDRGIIHPATFTGQITGYAMVLTVVLTDTGRQVGPATLIFGKEPKMGPCPICRVPGERSSLTASRSHGEHGEMLTENYNGLWGTALVGERPISSRNWFAPVGFPLR